MPGLGAARGFQAAGQGLLGLGTFLRQAKLQDEEQARRDALDRQAAEYRNATLGLQQDAAKQQTIDRALARAAEGFEQVDPGADARASIHEANQYMNAAPGVVNPLPNLGTAIRQALPTVTTEGVTYRINPANNLKLQQQQAADDRAFEQRKALAELEHGYRSEEQGAVLQNALKRMRLEHDLAREDNPLATTGQALDAVSGTVDALVAMHGGDAQAALNYATRLDQPETRAMVKRGQLTPQVFQAAARRYALQQALKEGQVAYTGARTAQTENGGDAALIALLNQGGEKGGKGGISLPGRPSAAYAEERPSRPEPVQGQQQQPQQNPAAQGPARQVITKDQAEYLRTVKGMSDEEIAARYTVR